MITVTIAINEKVIFARSGHRIGDEKDPKKYQYKLDDGTILTHNYEEGCVPLAKKMLDTIQED